MLQSMLYNFMIILSETSIEKTEENQPLISTKRAGTNPKLRKIHQDEVVETPMEKLKRLENGKLTVAQKEMGRLFKSVLWLNWKLHLEVFIITRKKDFCFTSKNTDMGAIFSSAFLVCT